MKFCIEYNFPGIMYLDKADEIRIYYRPQDDTLKTFLQQYKDKRIFIQAPMDLFKDGGSTIKAFKKLKDDPEVPSNWTLQIYSASIITDGEVDKYKLEAIKESCHKFMFCDNISDWVYLDFALRQGVSDVYVTGELGFSLRDVKKQCSKYNTEDNQVGIRCIANLINSIDVPAHQQYNQYTAFFIRPEDTIFYEDLIDAIEVYGKSSKEEQEVHFKAYALDKQWYGNLNEIIYGLTIDIDSRSLIQQYGKYRSGCKRRCEKGSYCDICRSCVTLGNNLKEADLRVIPPTKLTEEEQRILKEMDEILSPEDK